MKPFVEYYRKNSTYSDYLAGQDHRFFAKYVDALVGDAPHSRRVLDVGCGAGQALAMLAKRGADAQGVEVSEPNVRRVRAEGLQCQLYDGVQLPFEAGGFDSVGAFNVIEHVEQPERLVMEMVRVVRVGGEVVVSAPNFLRFLGWRDYHPRMRGVRNKWTNGRLLWRKWMVMRRRKGDIRFDRMRPIDRQPFQPDDDAIIVTNLVEMRGLLRTCGCRVLVSECTDRYIPSFLNRLANLTPLKYGVGNAFLVARKSREPVSN